MTLKWPQTSPSQFTHALRRAKLSTAQKACLFDAIRQTLIDGDAYHPSTIKSLATAGYIQKVEDSTYNDYIINIEKVYGL